MKKINLLILCSFCIILVHGQAVITNLPSTASQKNIKTDFGALGNGSTDDTWAFIKAGKYFSNSWDINGVPLAPGTSNFSYATNSGLLEIPAGTYMVGRQVAIPSAPGGLLTTYGDIFLGSSSFTASISSGSLQSSKLGLELIVLTQVDQLIIKGDPVTRPVIKYNSGLTIGYFDNAGNPITASNSNNDVNIGAFIQTSNCKNLAINNIEIDGNNSPAFTTYGGSFGGEGIQKGARALYLADTKNITIENINAHHMTLDGLELHDFYKDPVVFPLQANTNLSVINSHFDYNRRQGFSWVGGRGITVQNCTFNETGRSVPTGPGVGNPGAGLDIEPEHAGSPLWCMDGAFTNCEFINNLNVAIVNDIEAGGTCRTKNITFNNATIHDVDSYGLWIKGKSFTFNDSKIWGSFTYGNDGLIPGEETVFNSCDFADEEILSQPGVFFTQQLVESNGTKRMKFNDCTFRTLHAGKQMLWMYTNTTNEAEYTIFKNCNFTAGPNSNTYNYIFGCAFDGNTNFLSLNPSAADIYSMNGIVFLGSNSPCNHNKFNIKGHIYLYPANTNGLGLTQFDLGRYGIGTANTDGYVDVEIDNDAILHAYSSQTINIGKNSRFINKPNGQFVIYSGTINNAGKVILDNGSYTAFFNSVNINTSSSGHPEFYLHKNANMGYTPTWGPVFGWIYTSFMSQAMTANTVVDGGSTAVTTPYAGPLNTALSFAGTGDYVNIPAAGASSKLANFAGLNAFSIEVSFKHSGVSLSSSPKPLFAQGDKMAFGIYRNGRFYFKYPTGANTTVSMLLPTGLSPSSGTCNSAVITREVDNYFRVYLDEQLIYTSATSFAGQISSNVDSYIGRELIAGSSTQYFFDGNIGRVRLWKRALTQADICYNSSRKVPLNPTDLVADWDMTDASGTTLTDATSSPANGTLTGILSAGPHWVTQNTVGDCINAAGTNNAGYINFRGTEQQTIITQSGTINDKTENLITTYPNPNRGIFTVDATGVELKRPLLQIYDTAGKLIWQKQYTNNNKSFLQQVTVKNSTGVYFLKITSEKKVYFKKLFMHN